MGCYRQLNVRIFTVVERGAPNWRRRRGVMKEGKERATPPPLFSLLVNKVRHLAPGSDRCHNLVLPKERGGESILRFFDRNFSFELRRERNPLHHSLTKVSLAHRIGAQCAEVHLRDGSGEDEEKDFNRSDRL